MLWKRKGGGRKSPLLGKEEKKNDSPEGSRQPGENLAFLTCKGLWKRIRCLILLSEQTRRSSCRRAASKAQRQPCDQATRGMSQS